MQRILGHIALGGRHLPDRLCRGAPPQTGGSMVAGELASRHGSLSVAIKGRPRIGSEAFDASSIGQRILDLYRARGTGFLASLRGPFSLAIVDAERAEVLLAIDRMGIEKLAWGFVDGLLSFGTSASDVARALSASPRLNPQALFDFMLGHMIAAPDSAYLGVSKLLAGTYVLVRDGKTETGRYWEPAFDHVKPTEVEELRKQVLPTIADAIDRCEPGERTGTFLSGGLDSSTVTGLFARKKPAAHAFSVGFGVDEFNELAYARIAAAHFDCTHHIYEVVPSDVVELVPIIAAAYDEPFGNSSAVPTLCCVRFAQQHGIDHMLAGDGGDELFGGNSRYVRHKIFELYTRIPAAIRSAVLEPLAARLDPESAPLPLRKFSSYVRQARVPLPERFESWNMIYREGPGAVFDADFLSMVDPQHPLKAMRELWEACPSNDLLDRMLWYDWKLTLADNDLRKVSTMCETAGVRVSYPMLDEDLVDLSLRVPSSMKISGNTLRRFFKDATRGFLPDEIVRKTKHGFGLPFGVWLQTDAALQDLVYGSLASLRRRGLIKREFIDRVESEHRSGGHASYYGYAIWDMVMLEQWLDAQAPGDSRSVDHSPLRLQVGAEHP